MARRVARARPARARPARARVGMRSGMARPGMARPGMARVGMRPGMARQPAANAKTRMAAQRAKPLLRKAVAQSNILKKQVKKSAIGKKKLAKTTKKSSNKMKADVNKRKNKTKKEIKKKQMDQQMGGGDMGGGGGAPPAPGPEMQQMMPEMAALDHMSATDAPMLDRMADQEFRRDLPQLERAEHLGDMALAEANRGILDPQTMHRFEAEEQKAVAQIYRDAKKSDAILRDEHKALQLLKRHLMAELGVLKQEIARAKNDKFLVADIKAKMRIIQSDLSNIKFMLRLIKNEDMEEKKTIQDALQLYKTLKMLRGAEAQERQAIQQNF